MKKSIMQTAPRTDAASIIAYIDQVIDVAKNQRGESGSFVPEAARSQQSVPSSSEVLHKIEDIDTLVTRLERFKQWLIEDSRMLLVVDSYVGERVKESEERLSRRNLKQNIILAVLSSIGGSGIGWLLSMLGTPGDVVHLFVR